MLTDEELHNLPSDPVEAFIQYERLLWKYTQLEIEQSPNGWYWERRYVQSLIIFEQTHELRLLFRFYDMPRDDSAFKIYFHDFRDYIQNETLRLRLEKAKAAKSGIVTVLSLNPSHKEKVRFHIEKIRSLLESVDIPERKRESLFKKLNAFAADVDQNLTKLDALMSLMLEVSSTAGKVADNLKPVRDLLDPLFNWLGKAKEENEALPSPERKPQIEGPRKQLPAPEQDGSDPIDL
ncbi:hypothetical protein [Microvirga subterranea]|uniref:Uncharacterized protein n=1 Tax=Microvirga subterranea TaxID=186651 RepID=A0A370HU15_9HYPH|nr:hypothetical protein [Microvirga subterranea]RDI62008.1 hypothetical protein DES45_101269 [Microvirga subterranea]